jgi:hypothetical protein
VTGDRHLGLRVHPRAEVPRHDVHARSVPFRDIAALRMSRRMER